MPTPQAGTVPFMAVCDDEFTLILPPSDDVTRVRVRHYPADQLRFLIARPEENSTRVIAVDGGAYVISCKTTRPVVDG